MSFRAAAWRIGTPGIYVHVLHAAECATAEPRDVVAVLRDGAHTQDRGPVELRGIQGDRGGQQDRDGVQGPSHPSFRAVYAIAPSDNVRLVASC